MRKAENIKKATYSLPTKKRLDWAIQGLQVQHYHVDIWSEIKGIVKEYDVNMNRIGPVVTTLTYKNVLLAKKITEKIKSNPKIRDYADECGFPTKTVYYRSDNPEKIIDSVIFLSVFRLLMGVNFSFTEEPFQKYIENGVSEDILKELLTIKGDTILETDPYIERVVEKVLKRMK
jgi:hypothetical protein